MYMYTLNSNLYFMSLVPHIEQTGILKPEFI